MAEYYEPACAGNETCPSESPRLIRTCAVCGAEEEIMYRTADGTDWLCAKCSSNLAGFVPEEGIGKDDALREYESQQYEEQVASADYAGDFQRDCERDSQEVAI